MNDLISRQDAIELIHSLYPSAPVMRMNRAWWKEKYKPYIEVEKLLEMLPSAQPEQRWIPCEERLPEDDTLMLVNYIDERPDAMDIWIGWHEMENVWYIDGEEHSREHGNEVIAWMPLPSPYGGES